MGSVKETEYSQHLPTAQDEVIYHNFWCRTDQTSLLVDTARHHQLHNVEDEHTYEEMKCESDGIDILNTILRAIEQLYSHLFSFHWSGIGFDIGKT